MDDLIRKVIGCARFHTTLIFKKNTIRYKKIKQYMGRFARIKTNSKGNICIGKALYLSDRSVIGAYKGGQLSIGDNNFFNSNCNIICYQDIKIGDNNLFAQNIVITDNNHRYDIPDRLICQQGFICEPVVIGSDCWICANVVICPGSVINDHIVIAANSVVTGRLNTPGLYGGIPARLIKVSDKKISQENYEDIDHNYNL